ncbi:MAG: SDR family oxidoreductase [Verrucomicrobia bacterium]|nr:SDR family oxidoreductase [Verrucomicrobiota bacterium]
MDFGISDKRALVGGASKGLGLASAVALAREGCEVAIVSRSEDNLKRALQDFDRDARVLPVVADLGSAEGIGLCMDQLADWGPVDILVTNTGGPPPGASFDRGEADWRNACELLLFSVKRLVDILVPHMRERKWGRIIAITSRTVKEPAGNLVLSNVFRTAVTSYLKVLSKELAADGITVNSVLPGNFRTERYEQLIKAMAEKAGKSPEDMAEDIIESLPQKRFQRPEELGELVAFLASVRASGITGTAIPVDGGVLSGLLS